MPTSNDHLVPGSDATKERSQTEQTNEESLEDPSWSPEEALGIVTIAASARAEELRVDECNAATSRGETEVQRFGLPKTGAEPGVTYSNVRVAIEVQGQARRR